ncbi:MAG: DUF6688 domain-containing protein [Fastidiosipilaceae bacterium]
MTSFILILIALPLVLSLWNLFTFIWYLAKKKERRFNKWIEIVAILIGVGYQAFYMEVASGVVFANWDVQLYNSQVHSMIAPDYAPTISVILLIALIGYIVIRFVPAGGQSPIVSVVGIAAIYLGIGVSLLWCVQTVSDIFLLILPINCILILIKAIYIFVRQKNNLMQDKTNPTRFKRLSKLLNNAANLPWLALLFVIPLLGVIILILLLFGQEPNSVIKAWTETADWTMSQKTAPQNIFYDEHYLCTVAAGGHQKVVKPIRTGLRHGNRVIVNRQLCVANAFEQVLEERTPRFHKLVRGTYDKLGYPISKHIRSKLLADIIYFLMKPLEWFFLLVLYSVDLHPEDRIAVQYPHAPLPKE